MSLTSVKPNLIFPECPTASTPLFRTAGVQRRWGPSLTFTAIFPTQPPGYEHLGAGLGSTGYTCAHTALVILGDGMPSHPWASDCSEFPACHYSSCKCRTGNQTILRCTVLRCSVKCKHWGRIEIRFSTNQRELSSESIANSELRKDFSSLKRCWLYDFEEMIVFKHSTACTQADKSSFCLLFTRDCGAVRKSGKKAPPPGI